ncbi:AmmeMemoRadiSam system protein B [Malikia sp.]|uniref:AmmeMemoRadiSam system protein B n=1 Tax=Malikia sp. TaxID=2070706 RepID=UPI0026289ABB|nr:AmmeMemoRadiSam system protein B [Malikia sp.]MDD2729069.1 AmmeMemoRadiSam system protein B [Malikia sp.]
MPNTRPAAVAGLFYPGDAVTLARTVAQSLARATQTAGAAGPSAPDAAPKALIVPHAGYVYSGATAAQAYALLAPQRDQIRRVVLLGPVHRVPVRGLALPDADAFETPLGRVEIDAQAVAELQGLPQVTRSRAAHAQEHSLEVQLPFLQTVLADFKLLPLAVGDASPAEVAEVLERLWGGPETLIVVSSDLSHFLDHDSARATDGATLRQILTLQGGISHRQACGATPVNGLLLAARGKGLSPRLIAQCNSGDTTGERQRVVGYASVSFNESVPVDAPATVQESLHVR